MKEAEIKNDLMLEKVSIKTKTSKALEKKPNVLLVDDLERNILESNIYYIEQIVKSLEVNIIKAYSYEETLSTINGQELALVLIDLRMPHMDGNELASRILNDSDRNLVPIIFISAHSKDELQIEKCYESGIVDFIQKPFTKNILIRKIKIFLELFRQKNQILESENMCDTLLNASPESILVMDLNGRITDVSNMAIGLFGNKSRAELLGKQFFELTPRKENGKLKTILNKTLVEGLVQNVEVRLAKDDRSQFISEISMTLITKNGGTPKALMAIIRDITQRKIVEQQLIHTDRLVSLGEMATSIAHEINQPLNTISLSLENVFLEINKRMAIKETYFQKKSDKILENISRIRNIIDHIRAFSMDHDDYLDSSFDMHDSIRDAISIVSEQLRHKSIDLITLFHGVIDPVQGNTHRFEQVILNLLINSKDAIEEKKRKLKKNNRNYIEIKTYRDAHHIFVDIRDDGIGIKAKNIHKIMLPFFTTKETDKGTGLGLSISSGIIRKMNGKIDVESEYLSGTTMRIVLPLKKSNG